MKNTDKRTTQFREVVRNIDESIPAPAAENATEFNKGAAYMRDCIIANIIGVQNTIADKQSGEYTALQSLLIAIEIQYGALGTKCKI